MMGREIDLEELETRMHSFDWSKIFYDPMDMFNIDHDEDRHVFAKLESIIHDVTILCNSSKKTEDIAIGLCKKYWTGHPMEQQIPERRAIHMDIKVEALALEEKFKSINWMQVQLPGENRKVMSLIRLTQAISAVSPGDGQFIRQLTQKYFEGTVMERFIQKAAPNLKTNIMNEQNFEYLQNTIKFLGFGEQLSEALKEKMQSGETEFSLHFKAGYENKDFEASLQFKKSSLSENYFLNGYDAKLKNEIGLRAHAFRLDKGKGVTMKEAYNLLDGRSVYKELTNREGQSYNAWIKLDFDSDKVNERYKLKQYHDNYGFDVAKTLKNYPQIKETQSQEEFTKLVRSLYKGNEQTVGLVNGEETRSIKISADPQVRTIASSDEAFNVLKQQVAMSMKQSIGESLPAKSQRQSVSKDPESSESSPVGPRKQVQKQKPKIH
jgi:hypothetical protein